MLLSPTLSFPEKGFTNAYKKALNNTKDLPTHYMYIINIDKNMVLKPHLVEEYDMSSSLHIEDMICLIDAKKEEDTVTALRTIVETMASGWMEQRVDRWKKFENRCIVNVDHQYRSYTICLSLRSDEVDPRQILSATTSTCMIGGFANSDDDDSDVMIKHW